MFHFRPKKFKKFHKHSVSHKNSVIFRQNPVYGTYMIKSLDFFDFTVPQILACKALITKLLKAENKVITSKLTNVQYSNGRVRVLSDFNSLCSYRMPLFPDFTDTSKPRETRMGKGKGNVSVHFFPVKKGKILFEFRNLNFRLAQKCLKLIESKLPGRAKLVSRLY